MTCLRKVVRATNRIISVSFVMLLLMIAANAYTLVMRSGRRVEIPSTFMLTPSTLTYEVSQGIQITLQVAVINIPATELANHEAPGSFLKRMQLGAGASFEQEPNAERDTAVQARTITNRDLAASMQRRRASELAYERRRKELGLPSVADSRKRAAAESELIGRELGPTLAAERQTESYWRGRASALRTEIAVVDAELAYTRARLDEIPESNGSFTTVDSYGSYDPFGNLGRRQRRSRGGYGGRAPRGGGVFDPWGFPQGNPPYVLYPNGGPYGSNGQPYDYTYERSALITRFNELAATRAGFSARWRELEEEARRAGASPGWLRP
jgi:hypothetical protein